MPPVFLPGRAKSLACTVFWKQPCPAARRGIPLAIAGKEPTKDAKTAQHLGLLSLSQRRQSLFEIFLCESQHRMAYRAVQDRWPPDSCTGDCRDVAGESISSAPPGNQPAGKQRATGNRDVPPGLKGTLRHGGRQRREPGTALRRYHQGPDRGIVARNAFTTSGEVSSSSCAQALSNAIVNISKG